MAWRMPCCSRKRRGRGGAPSEGAATEVASDEKPGVREAKSTMMRYAFRCVELAKPMSPTAV